MSEHMTVIHSAGGAELQAAVTPGTDRGWAAIVCHPWGKLGGDMNNPVVVSLRNGLAKRGFTVCRYVPPFSPVFKRMRVFTKVWCMVVCVPAMLSRVICNVVPEKLRVRANATNLCVDDDRADEENTSVGCIILWWKDCVRRFNFRGVGGSTGGSSFTGTEERKDVQSVCRFVVQNILRRGLCRMPFWSFKSSSETKNIDVVVIVVIIILIINSSSSSSSNNNNNN